MCTAKQDGRIASRDGNVDRHNTGAEASFLLQHLWVVLIDVIRDGNPPEYDPATFHTEIHRLGMMQVGMLCMLVDACYAMPHVHVVGGQCSALIAHMPHIGSTFN